MSNPGLEDETPIASTAQLAEWLAAGGKPASDWRIGTEHEKFGFFRPGRDHPYAPPPYWPGGIGALLQSLALEPGWREIRDAGNLIGLAGPAGASLSLEPGGQFELSGAPLADLHATKAELQAHFDAIRAPAARLGLGFAPLGFHPTARREEMPWMPKSRYAIMRRYMPQVGSLGLDMMLRTCTVQVNLDFADEADMRRKLRVSLLLQPIATALFANSPFTEGRLNGLLSARAKVWTDTDPDRTGAPDLMLDEGFGFEAYVEWLLDVPMYFVARGGRLIDVAGASLRDFLAGKVDALRGITPTLGDFADHLTTVFPDVRLKRFLEMRGADAGSPSMMLAQSAFWVGLLYDAASLAAADAFCREWDRAAWHQMRADIPRLGLNAALGELSARTIAAEAVRIAGDGLRARGLGEEIYLAPLADIAAGAPTQAEHWLSRYEGAWQQDVRHIWGEAAV